MLFGPKKYRIHFFSFFDLKSLFCGWWDILKIAIPAGSVSYLKWLQAEVLTFLVIYLKDRNAMAGHSAFLSINLFFSMLIKGLSSTTSIFISNAMGKR